MSISFEPVRIIQLELSRLDAAWNEVAAAHDTRYRRVRLLARLFDYPVGYIEVSLSNGELNRDVVLGAIWQQLSEAINKQLSGHRLAPLQSLPAEGVYPAHYGTVLEQRRRLLENAPLITVVVPTRERVDTLRDTLKALLVQTHPCYEIIVVDNAPKTEATRNLIQSEFADRVRYRCEPRPGASNARNCGLRAAQGEIIAFTDDDVIPDQHWLSALWSAFQSSPSVACVTGLILPYEVETEAQEVFEKIGAFPKKMERQYFDMDAHSLEAPFYPYNAGIFGASANMAIRTSVLNEMNGFDPALGPGTKARAGEDSDLFFRLLIDGNQLLYEPNALVHHRHRRDSAGLEQQMYNYGVSATAYMTKTMLTRPLLMPGFTVEVVRVLVRALRTPAQQRKAERHVHYPEAMMRLIWNGRLNGPWAYMRSRWQQAQFAATLSRRLQEN